MLPNIINGNEIIVVQWLKKFDYAESHDDVGGSGGGDVF